MIQSIRGRRASTRFPEHEPVYSYPKWIACFWRYALALQSLLLFGFTARLLRQGMNATTGERTVGRERTSALSSPLRVGVFLSAVTIFLHVDVALAYRPFDGT